MIARDRTYYLRWSMLVGGITAWALVATLIDATLSPPGTEMPDWPRPAVVAPVDALLDDAPVDLSATLPLTVDSLGTSAARGADVEEMPVARPETVALASGPTASRSTSAPPTVRDLHYGEFPTTYDDQLRLYRTLERKPGANAGLDLGGLVVDETITPHGRIFYTDFFDVWQSPSVEGFYTVRVQEKPTPGRGTLVEVFVNDDITFRTRLQPQTQIAEQALQAARRTYQYVRSGRGILQIR